MVGDIICVETAFWRLEPKDRKEKDNRLWEPKQDICWQKNVLEIVHLYR